MVRRLALVIVFVALAAGAWRFHQEIGRTFSADPTVWEPEIAAFERADAESGFPRDAILFVGSSSIRFWDDLADDMAPLRVIRRGWGGAKISDLIHFADRVIVPYAPRAIVIHAGGNELNAVPGNAQRSPAEAMADFRILVAKIRSALPETPLYYLALRPSNVPGPRDAFLALMRVECESSGHLTYLDFGAVLSLPNGAPNPELIGWDFIHLNREGYRRWAPPLRARLLADLGPAAAE